MKEKIIVFLLIILMSLTAFNYYVVEDSFGIGLDPNWGDVNTNTVLCNETGNQAYQQMISDGSGGAFIVFTDYRNGTSDIYAQRIDKNGNLLWQNDAVPICTAAKNQLYPMIISDGSGGAIITWMDNRTDIDWDIYVQRINANGEIQWSENGTVVVNLPGNEMYPVITTDGSGGAIITWRYLSGTSADIYAQHFNSTGDKQWSGIGKAVSIASGTQQNPVIIDDGLGGAIIAWEDRRGSSWDVYAQRLDSTGNIQWTLNGEPICTIYSSQDEVMITTDGYGGAIIGWQDSRNGVDLYAQLINLSGDIQWQTDGIPICESFGGPTEIQMISDNHNGAIFAWQEDRGLGSFNDIYAQRVNETGVTKWVENGTVVCNATDSQTKPQLVGDGSGGAIVVWQDWRSLVHDDIYAQAIDKNGYTLWGLNGTLICNNTADQTNPELILDSEGGVIIAWMDYRDSNFDLYAQRIGLFITTTSPPTMINEDTYYSYDFNANDNTHTIWTLDGNASWLKINSNTGLLNGTPNNTHIGWFWVNVTITDSMFSDQLSFKVTVSNVNDAPNITTPNNGSAIEDVYYSQTYNAIDIDPTSDVLTWQIDTNASSWLHFNTNNGVLNGTPGNEHVGWYWVNISVMDGKGGEDNTSFILTVANENDPPVISTSDVNITNEDELYNVHYQATDIDPTNDQLTWDLTTTAGAWLSFNTTTGNLFGIPTNDDVGAFDINISVYDGNGGFDRTDFVLKVMNVNDPPKITTLDNQTAYEDELYKEIYQADDIDPTDDILTWSFSTNANWLDFNLSTGNLSGSPQNSDAGEYWVNLSVIDGNGGIDWHNFTLTVKPKPMANQNPVITTTNIIEIIVNKLYSVTYAATDDRTNSANLIWSMDTNASWLKFNSTSKELSGTPKDADVGSYWVLITVFDGEGGSAFTNFTVLVKKSVTPENTKPELSDGKLTPDEGTTDTLFTFSVVYTDADNDSGEVWVWINGDKHEMTKDQADNDFTDGVEYTYKTKLTEGDHTYYFTATDGKDPAIASDGTPIDSSQANATPEIQKIEDEKSGDDAQDLSWLLYLIVIVVIIVILLVVIFTFGRKKRVAEPPMDDRVREEEEQEETEIECRECGAILLSGESVCPDCGADIADQVDEEEKEEEQESDDELEEEDLDEEELTEEEPVDEDTQEEDELEDEEEFEEDTEE